MSPRLPDVGVWWRGAVWRGVLCTVLLALAACGGDTARSSPDPIDADAAFIDVAVIPMDRERVLEHQTVLVRDGRIVAMGAADEMHVAGRAQRIDGTGRFLIPGLAEMHAHLSGAPPPDVDVRNTYFLYVANGVTVVRGMAASRAQFAWRRQIEAGEIVGPDVFIASPGISGRITAPDEAATLVREYAAAGYDLIKLREGLTPDVFDATAAAARDAGIPIAGHVSDLVGLRRTLAAKPATLEHLDNYVEALVPAGVDRSSVRPDQVAPLLVGEVIDDVDETLIPEVVRLTKRSGAYLSPSMALWESYLGGHSRAALLARHPEVRYLPGDVVAGWLRAFEGEPYWHTDAEDNARVLALRRRLLKALHDADVPIVLGADTPGFFSVPGFATHRELQLYVAIGLTPYEALETATRDVAASLDQAESFGTVAVGRRANLVLLTANPLDDIGNATRRAGVMVHGRWLSEDELQAGLADIAALYGE